MIKHKYVRHSIVGFILFPDQDLLWHRHVGDLVRECAGGKIISAGFAHISKGGVECFGESESLEIKSLPEDSDLLSTQLGLM